RVSSHGRPIRGAGADPHSGLPGGERSGGDARGQSGSVTVSAGGSGGSCGRAPGLCHGTYQGALQHAGGAFAACFSDPSPRQYRIQRIRMSTHPPSAGNMANASPVKWRRAAWIRRTLLTIVVLLQTLVGSYYMSSVLPYHGGNLVE